MRERELRALARQMAERYGLDPEVFLRLIQQESGFNPQAGTERTGATGLGQVMGPRPKIRGSVSHLCETGWIRWRTCGSVRSIWRLCSANTTAITPRRLLRTTQGRGQVDEAGGIPAFEETQNYVARIMGGQLRPEPRPANLTREEGEPMRPEMRPDPDSLNIMARPQNMRISSQLRPEGIAGLMQ
jgi:hypothetical protein